MSASSITETSQYLTFKLDDEVFAVDVANVREILDLTPITKIPGTPDFMRGIINVRGNVVPVVDMRLKFSMSMSEATVNTCIVVLEVIIEDDVVVLGALVDSVQEVFELEPDQIEMAPKIGTKWRTELIKGIGKRNNEMIIIIDIAKAFSFDELSVIQEAGYIAPDPPRQETGNIAMA